MKNIKEHQLKKCIFMETYEFDEIIRQVFGVEYVVEFSLDGMSIGNDEFSLDNETINKELSKYFDCNITSIHMDDCDEIGVWICYEEMKSFIVSWSASGYTGTFRYLVVADSRDKAMDIWKEFVSNNKDVKYSWEEAEKGVENHYGGFITWKDNGNCNKEMGCYELEYKVSQTGSDHLWD